MFCEAEKRKLRKYLWAEMINMWLSAVPCPQKEWWKGGEEGRGDSVIDGVTGGREGVEICWPSSDIYLPFPSTPAVCFWPQSCQSLFLYGEESEWKSAPCCCLRRMADRAHAACVCLILDCGCECLNLCVCLYTWILVCVYHREAGWPGAPRPADYFK